MLFVSQTVTNAALGVTVPAAAVFYKALLPTASFNVHYQSVFHSFVLALFPSPCHPSL